MGGRLCAHALSIRLSFVALVLGACSKPVPPGVVLSTDASAADAAPSLLTAGDPVEDFRLLDHEGRAHQLSRAKKAPAVVVFSYGIECPIARKSIALLKELRDRYAKHGVVFWLLDPKTGDSREALVREAKDFGIDLPILEDEEQLVFHALGMTRTAEAAVIQPKSRRLLYRGALDDRLDYGDERPTAKNHFVADALDDVLAQRLVRVSRSEAKGCAIAGDRPPPTWASVGATMRDRCAVCHVDRGPAWPMDSYETVANWLPMIREVLFTRRMPPWNADKHYGKFGRSLTMTSAERRAIVDWIEAGAPRGDGPDPLAAPVQRPPARDLGEPLTTLRWKAPQYLPESGKLPYRWMQLPVPLATDVIVRGTSFRIQNSRVVHHINVMATKTPLSEFPKAGRGITQPEGSESIMAWVPGQIRKVVLPDDVGILVPAGSYLTAAMHYTTSGKPESDDSAIELYAFGPKDRPPAQLLKKVEITRHEFSIPAEADDFELTASLKLDAPTKLHMLAPHMHFRGKRMRCRARFPDGHVETLLSVPSYDFNWQFTYPLLEPRVLPAGTELLVDGAFDNSSENPHNPDPGATVRFGRMSQDEMFTMYMAHLVPNVK